MPLRKWKISGKCLMPLKQTLSGRGVREGWQMELQIEIDIESIRTGQ